MKGLLLKDYYLIRSILYIILAVFAVIGIGMSFLTSTWVLTVIATAMLGMISVTTINMDKSSGWRKISVVLPVSRKTFLDSKYILYLLLSGIGLFLGITLSVIVSVFKGQLDYNSMLQFISISIAMALFSGSMTIPFAFLFSEEKSMLGLIIAYPLSAAVFVGAALLIDNKIIACGLVAVAGILLYTISWLIARKLIIKRDIV